MIRLDKSLPKYIYKFNVALLTFFILWFTAVVAVMVAVGCIYGEHFITYAVMIGGFSLFVLGFIAFLFVDNKLHKRLINERTAELEKEFCEMPFEEAERILKEKGIITDSGFVVKDDGVFGAEVLPFEKVWFELNFGLLKNAEIDVWLFVQENPVPVKFNSTKKAQYKLDCALYNFIANKEAEIEKSPVFNLLVKDKREFAEWALKYTRTLQWDLSSYRYR